MHPRKQRGSKMKENSDEVASKLTMTPQIGSKNVAYTKTSLFSKIALAVGILNGLIMSYLCTKSHLSHHWWLETAAPLKEALVS